MEKCETEMITINGEPFGSKNTKIDIYIHKVKGKEDTNRKAMLWFHGGAFIMESANKTQPTACRLAVESDCTVFNCNYTKGPSA